MILLDGFANVARSIGSNCATARADAPRRVRLDEICRKCLLRVTMRQRAITTAIAETGAPPLAKGTHGRLFPTPTAERGAAS
jgi:hypothetical protein